MLSTPRSMESETKIIRAARSKTQGRMMHKTRLVESARNRFESIRAGAQRILDRWIMRADWNRRARKNPLHYVATSERQWSEEEFFASGETTTAQHILNDMVNITQGDDPRQMRVLEIGCGVGRITRALAHIFGEVVGVDVSHEMIRHATHYLSDLPNVRYFKTMARPCNNFPTSPSTLCFQCWSFNTCLERPSSRATSQKSPACSSRDGYSSSRRRGLRCRHLM